MYFSSFYASQALLAKHIGANPSHKNVETELHRRYGRSSTFPRRYVRLHDELHRLRNEFDYKTAHSPSPTMLATKQRVLQAYLAFALKRVPRIDVVDLLRGILAEHGAAIRDLSYDVYCPRTYAHHTRLTVWQPPFYLDIFTPSMLAGAARQMLESLRVRRTDDYVVGINSRVNQYESSQLVFLDIDSVDAGVEAELKKLGGILLKTGRGFHFIGTALIRKHVTWEKLMRRLARSRVLRRYVDQDHIAISLKRGYSTLRVTESPAKPTVPFFYKEL